MIRIGSGIDAHQLVAGRPLILGGVTIPHDMGLEGHSDGDALLHAVMDALLGAARLGDLGQHFPSGDERYRGADSRILLRVVRDLLTEQHCAIENIDATVIAQAPRIGPFKEQMAANIAADLCIDIDQVSVKATTTDELGAFGRKEGIAAHAVALISR